MNVVAAHMSRGQTPLFTPAGGLDGLKSESAGGLVEMLRILNHFPALVMLARVTFVEQSRTEHVVMPIHRAVGVTVRMRTVTGEGYQVSERRAARSLLLRGWNRGRLPQATTEPRPQGCGRDPRHPRNRRNARSFAALTAGSRPRLCCREPHKTGNACQQI